jgi:hypothetical protein
LGGVFNPELLREYFCITNHYEILSLMPIGYPASDAEPGTMHSEKFPIVHIVFTTLFDA